MKEKINELLQKLGIYSSAYRNQIIEKALSIDRINDATPESLEAWFNSIDFSKVIYKATYFLRGLEMAVRNGYFDRKSTTQEEENNSSSASISEISIEDFEKEWDEWCRLVEDLSLDPENPDVPGKGILIGELHCVDGARGISTGDGGFVYLDGTVSQRFKRFEDLSIQEKEDLINAFDKRNSVPGGRLIIADALLQKMKSLMGGHENERDR